jgi:hypothetical protein
VFNTLTTLPPVCKCGWLLRSDASKVLRIQASRDELGDEGEKIDHKKTRRLSDETPPITVQRIGGVRTGRTPLHNEKSTTLELAANH